MQKNLSINLLSNEQKKILIRIKYLYGLNQVIENGLIKQYFSPTIDENYSSIELIQTAFIEFILNDEYLTRFPPSLKYRQLFMKNLLNLLEKLSNESSSWYIDERFYELLLDTLNQNSSNQHNPDLYFTVIFNQV